MSILHNGSSLQSEHIPLETTRHPVRRLLILGLFLLVFAAFDIFIAQHADQSQQIVQPWLASFLPYLACCIFLLTCKPQAGRWRWIELGLIFAGAILLRALLIPLEPGFSRDSWRYLWDARVTLHGFSPYTHTPDDPLLTSLHDSLIYGHMDYHKVPTLYPPFAQGIYILSYLLAPGNLPMLKTIFMGFDLITCALLALMLHRAGQDPARCLLYAWCPLPIVEFALQGHIDVVMITLILLTLIAARSERRGARILTGFLLALATLTKLYPIVFLPVVLRRRDYALVITCFLTIVAGYLPYYILGHGQIFGFFSTYIKQRGGNAGFILLSLQWFFDITHTNRLLAIQIEHNIDIVLIGAVALLILVLRLFEKISMEGAVLALIGLVFSISSFVYPWYATACLPLVILMFVPLWTHRRNGGRRINPQGLVVIAAWYFVCTSGTAYLFLGAHLDWRIYYALVYLVVCLLLAGAAVLTLRSLKRTKKREQID